MWIIVAFLCLVVLRSSFPSGLNASTPIAGAVPIVLWNTVFGALPPEPPPPLTGTSVASHGSVAGIAKFIRVVIVLWIKGRLPATQNSGPGESKTWGLKVQILRQQRKADALPTLSSWRALTGAGGPALVGPEGAVQLLTLTSSLGVDL